MLLYKSFQTTGALENCFLKKHLFKINIFNQTVKKIFAKNYQILFLSNYLFIAISVVKMMRSENKGKTFRLTHFSPEWIVFHLETWLDFVQCTVLQVCKFVLFCAFCAFCAFLCFFVLWKWSIKKKWSEHLSKFCFTTLLICILKDYENKFFLKINTICASFKTKYIPLKTIISSK